jgi:hypothetical protein
VSSWFEERRADKAAEARQRREDRAFESKLRREEAREAKKERRDDEAQKRRDKAARRQARAARREKTLTPGNVYRKGTLALVAASALASLPAQVAHFVSVSLMLLPLPFALEGAAWVMAAGVAYADERKLPAWVRWLLRALSMGAAGYAAHINYAYGAQTNASVAWGLAGVTVMGPAVFEIRQWVSTLSAAAVDPKKRAEEKARAKHERRRYRHHKDVVKLARKLVSAAPYKVLAFEEAFASAWEIKYGTKTPGMTPALHAQALASRKALADAMDAANGSPVSVRGRLLELLHPVSFVRTESDEKPQVVTDLSPLSETSANKAAKGARRQPPPHRRTKGDSVPFSPVAKKQHSHEAVARLAANGHHH